ncbi:uncharacterized protein VP01_1906g4 [Puccinia sorghi]|uniref:Uncharacterized protein n=1 Tax=Puccinia sorghi TaxID=27349 RepID=A0A0L6VCS9_9BASI|nr:uncharacterized protein VP01_1906g4 [Puccinia sorghi]
MNNDEPDSPPCDDDLFNDPAFLAKIDQAANDHLSQRQQQSQQQHDERPAKRLKADNHLLQQQIDQVRNALQQAEKDKRTLSGQIAIIKSHLKLAKENNNQQLNQLQKQQQEYKSRAEEAEQRLAKLENQRALKDTFKGFEHLLQHPPVLPLPIILCISSIRFVASLRPDGAPPVENPGHRPPRAPLLPSLQVILDAQHQLPQTLTSAFDALVLELFTCLASAFDSNSLLNSTLTQHPGPSRPSDHASGNSKNDAPIMSFVARMGALFVQISSLLTHTDLIEAQTQVIHVLAILAQASPLFTSFFLHHPDFEDYLELSPVEQQPDLLAVLLAHFEVLDPHLGSLFLLLIFISPCLISSMRSFGTLLRFVVLRPWGNFLKSNGTAFFQFLVVGPHQQRQAAGVAEHEDDLMLTKKSIDVLLSLASSFKFILHARVLEATRLVSLSTPLTSNLNGNPSQQQQPQQQQQQQAQQQQKSKTLPTKDLRRTVTPSTTLDPNNKKTAQQSEVETTTVVDRLMKIFLLAATNREVCRPSKGDVKVDESRGDTDRHELKVKILSLLHLLAVMYRGESATEDVAGGEWGGWQALAQAGSFLFSVLIKTTFVDSYRLCNVDGAVGHRLLVPQYIQRIGLAVEIIHKMIFPQSSSSSPISSRTPMNLINRLKQESAPFASALSTLSVPPSSSSSSSTSGTTMCFSKLGWLDDRTPAEPSSFPFPWDPRKTHFGTLFNSQLPLHLFAKLDLLAGQLTLMLVRVSDLAWDVLSSVASPDELDEWRRAALDEDSSDDESPKS